MIKPLDTLFLARKSNFLFKLIRNLCTESSLAQDQNAEIKQSHIPVMLNEVVEHLNLKRGNLFLDMTFGAGGHSSALLERIPELRIVALDRDPVAQEFMEELRKRHPNQVTPLLGRFSDLPQLLKEYGIQQNSFDGILFDLGCSSMQFDYAERGFSISKNGPLDMRMDGERLPDQLTAADVIAYATERELIQIFKIYGEERKSKKLAKAIVEARYMFKPLTTTENLSELVEAICVDGEVRYDKLKRKAHVATKVFQALRIFVNNEMNELDWGLVLARKYLKPNGRAVAISFHSLEDRIVKNHFSNRSIDNCLAPLPLPLVNPFTNHTSQEVDDFQKKVWTALTKKVVLPSDKEIWENPRSRSAKLRAAVKLPD